MLWRYDSINFKELELYNYTTRQFKNISTVLKRSFKSSSNSTPTLNPKQPLTCFPCLPSLHISYKRKSTSIYFCIWLLSFSIIILRLIHVVCISTSSFYYWIVFHFMDTPHFLYLVSSCEHLAIMNKAPMKHTYISLYGNMFLFLSGTFILRNGTTELYAPFMLNFLRIWQFSLKCL